MRNAFIAGFFVACAAAAVAAQTAQTSPTPNQTPTAPNNGTMTLIGCIGGGATASDPYMLSNPSLATVGSATATQGGGVAGGTSAVVPTGTTGTRPGVTAATPATPPATVGATGTTGTSGVGVATGAGTGTVTGSGVGTMTGSGVGTMATGAAARPGSAPTVAPATGVGTMNPAGSTALSSSYRLSGYDVSGLKGQRVQIVGSLAPAGATTPGAPTTGAREFRVQSVQALPGGGCPQR